MTTGHQKGIVVFPSLDELFGCLTVSASVAIELIALFTRSVRTADLGSSLFVDRARALLSSLLLIISISRHWHISFPSTHFLNMSLIWSASNDFTVTCVSQLIVADRFPPISSALLPKDSPSSDRTDLYRIVSILTPSSPFSRT